MVNDIAFKIKDALYQRMNQNHAFILKNINLKRGPRLQHISHLLFSVLDTAEKGV